MAFMMVLSLGGCTLNRGTTWIAKSGDVTLPAGVYILNLSSNYSSAMSVLQQMYTEDAESVNIDNLWKNNLDGKALLSILAEVLGEEEDGWKSDLSSMVEAVAKVRKNQ